VFRFLGFSQYKVAVWLVW